MKSIQPQFVLIHMFNGWIQCAEYLVHCPRPKNRYRGPLLNQWQREKSPLLRAAIQIFGTEKYLEKISNMISRAKCIRMKVEHAWFAPASHRMAEEDQRFTELFFFFSYEMKFELLMGVCVCLYACLDDADTCVVWYKRSNINTHSICTSRFTVELVCTTTVYTWHIEYVHTALVTIIQYVTPLDRACAARCMRNYDDEHKHYIILY